jgi:beta-lactamase superfamily II metal-dependent hydrolase
MLSITALNVQNGDSLILEYQVGGHKYYGLIDSNIVNSTNVALKKLEEMGVEHLSFIMITHPHADHYSGIFEILRHYAGRVDQFITCPLGDILHNRDVFKKYCESYKRILEKQDDFELSRNTEEWLRILKYASENLLGSGKWQEMNGPLNRFDFVGFNPDVVFEFVMPPPKAKGGKYIGQIQSGLLEDPESVAANEISLALYVTYAGKTILLAGDSEFGNWQYAGNIYGSLLKKSAVVKLPHHGSKYDCDPKVIDLWYNYDLTSNIGIISAKGSKHPDEAVIAHLLKMKVRPYCTNLAKKWRAESSVSDFINTKGVEGNLARFVRQVATPKESTVVPCKGNITVKIAPDGNVVVDTEYNNVCGCCVNTIEDLLLASQS